MKINLILSCITDLYKIPFISNLKQYEKIRKLFLENLVIILQEILTGVLCYFNNNIATTL